MQALDGRLVLSPSDLNDYVECPHLTTLALEVARGTRKRPFVLNEHGDLLRRKGEEHEAAYLAALREQGRQVVDVIGADRWDFDGSARATIEAMRAGAEVIYQATFVVGDWRGRADFLERVEQPTALGGWGYEALDAKLARAEKPTYVLQLCFYSEAIAAIQQRPVGAMHVLLGIGERRTLRPDDFNAYYRRVRAGFLDAIGQGAPTEPYRVDHCGLCEFRAVCDARWEKEDHLLLVAGIRREHVTRLRSAGLGTLATLARAAETRVDQIASHTFEALRDQASLQLHRRTTGDLTWHALPIEAERGFDRLPRPSMGDVVFDIEGDPFWEPARGLHFLFGLLTPGDDWTWRYRAIWAHDRAGERRAFEALLDFFHERLARHPDMHVYHYGVYEPTALKQLMGVYATREDAVDELLRARGLRRPARGRAAGAPGRGVELLAQGRRGAAGLSPRGATSPAAPEPCWPTSSGCRRGPTARLDEIAAYNEEDCRATLSLRDWLLEHRPRGTSWATPPETRPVDDDRQKTDARARGAPPGVAGGQQSRRAALADGRAARVSPARGASGVVVVLPAVPDVGGRAGRGRRGDRSASARRARRAPSSGRWSTGSPSRSSRTSWRRATRRAIRPRARGRDDREARRDGGRAGPAALGRRASSPRRSSHRGRSRRPSSVARSSAWAPRCWPATAAIARCKTSSRARGRDSPTASAGRCRPPIWRSSAGARPRSTRAISSSRGRPAPARRGRAPGSWSISSAAAGGSAWRRRATRRFTTCSTRSRRPPRRARQLPRTQEVQRGHRGDRIRERLDPQHRGARASS